MRKRLNICVRVAIEVERHRVEVHHVPNTAHLHLQDRGTLGCVRESEAKYLIESSPQRRVQKVGMIRRRYH